MRLKGKVAMVTGGGSGIGRAIVLALAREGADILIPDIQMANAEAVVREVRGLGRTSIAQRVDVTNEAEIQTSIRDGIRAFGQIDILVNNAGVNPGLGLPFMRQVEADWDKVFDVNVKSVFFTCKTIAPHFMERRAGKIVNIASIAGPLSSTTMPSYSVSKMGIVTFTKIVAKDLAPYNVNVNAICPGFLWTPMWENLAKWFRSNVPHLADKNEKEIFEDRVKSMTPLLRPQTPEDIANLAAFLVSDQAGNLTGQSINLDGGTVMH